MFFNDALEMIAADLGIDPEKMKAYGAERDDIGGWNPDPELRQWDMGSMWELEGRALYAIIRALRPATVVEFGLCWGCSSKYILAALVKNKKGKLVSVDMTPRYSESDYTAAELKRWEVLATRVANAELPKTADIVFEDLMHDFKGTRDALKIAKKLKAPLAISHDGEHYIVGQNIRDAYMDVFGDFKSFSIEGCDCGYAYHYDPTLKTKPDKKIKKTKPPVVED